MQCPKCGDQNQQGINTICTNCNQVLNQCPNCNHQNPLFAQVCGSCGDSLAQAQAPPTPRNYHKGFVISFAILGFLFLALVFLIPVLLGWNPIAEIIIGIETMFFLTLWRKMRKGLSFLQSMSLWRMWHVYVAIAGLLLVLAIIKGG